MAEQYLEIRYHGMTDGMIRATAMLLKQVYDGASGWNSYYGWTLESTLGGWRFCFSCQPTSEALKDIAVRLSDVAELLGNRVVGIFFYGEVRGIPHEDGGYQRLVGHETEVKLEYVAPAVKEVTMAEVCERFGCEVKIIKE